MKNNKSRKVLLCLVLVLLTSICLLVGCKDKGITSISIKSTDMPRTTYVVGQDLDLSTGVLTVLKDGDESSVPMTADGVSVSGYDKNTVGKQTLTVSYSGKTTTFEVTVVARMTADGYKSEYFIGDKFDNSQGRLKIVSDDGKTTSVNLNSDGVTVKAFDSSKAGDSTVTVEYNNADGTVYTTSFTVKFHTIGDVKFTKPSKTVYASHDGEFSAKGGYFTVTALGTDLSSYVEITPDMVSGFDLSKATIANRDTALKQTVTVTYAGKSFNFEISILYSGVSIVNDAIKALGTFEPSGRDAVVTPELSATVVDAATEYFKLTQAKKELIDAEGVNKLMRTAALCVSRAFADSAVKFENTFKIDTEKGNLLINAQSYDQLKTDSALFDNKKDAFHVLASVLNSMKDEFKDLVLFSETVEDTTSEVTVADYIKSPSSEELDFYVNLFKFMLNVSDLLKTIPDEWTIATLEQYSKDIEEALNIITASGYIGSSFGTVYNSISSWRTKNDYFEIIYTYYLSDSSKHEEFLNKINTTKGLALPLPGSDLQVWYNYVSYGASELEALAQHMQNGVYLRDTTLFMHYYQKALEHAEAIKSHENQLYRDIYNLIGGDSMIYRYLEDPNYLGYYYLIYPTHESVAVKNLRDAYMELVALYYGGKIDIEENSAQFEAVISAMGKLTPSELFTFLSSLNFLYSSYGVGENYTEGEEYTYVLDYSTKSFSVLTYLMSFYNANKFEGNDRMALIQLFTAMEKCALIELRPNGLQEFIAEMNKLAETYNGMSKEKQDLFNEIAGECYAKYLAISQNYASTTTPELGDFADKFNQLKTDIEKFYEILIIVNDQTVSNEEKQYVYGILFPLAEKIISNYNALLTSPENETVVNALCTLKFNFSGESLTIDETMFSVKNSFYYNLTFRMINIGTEANPFNIPLWTIYENCTDLREFMILVSDVLVAYHKDENISKEAINAILEGFRAVPDAEKSLFYLFGMNIYYDTLLDYFVSATASDSLVRAILQAEIGYVEYIQNTEDEGRIEYFKKLMNAATSEYNKVSDKDSIDEMLRDFYDFYLGKYNEAFSTSDTQ